jgi:hypothetical protein
LNATKVRYPRESACNIALLNSDFDNHFYG